MPQIKKLAASLLICFAAMSSTHVLAASNASVKPTITTANPEFVYKYLLGEIAGQRGDMVLASQLFLDLAKQTRDPRLAERAARAAAYARQPGLALQASTLWAELDPSSLEAQQASSQLLVASGNLKEAKPHIKQLLAKEDTRANGFLYLNNLLEAQKDKSEVLDAVKEFAAPYPKLPEAHFAIAQAAWLADKSDVTKSELATTDKLRPGWEPSAQLQAQMLLKESPAKALDFLKSFLEKYPKSDDVRLSYAKLLVSQKRFAEAKPEFVKLSEAAKDRPEISAVVGLLSSESSDFTMADKYFQQALDGGFKDPEQVYLYLGRNAERSKNDGKALEWYDKVAPGDHYFESRLSAANVIARIKNADAAIGMLDEVNDLTPDQQVVVVQTEASILAQAKRNQDSFDLMQKAVNNLPNNPELMYDYAMSAERLGKLDIMETQLREVIKTRPDNAAAYNALGYSLADRNLRLGEAKTLIETAVKLAPGDHYMLDSLGWVHYRLGNLKLAAEYLRQAYDLQADPEIAAHLGEVLWKQGMIEEAKKIWADALLVNPENDILVSTANKFKS
jgi:tetratricopeptide (TPR) repeat protein